MRSQKDSKPEKEKTAAKNAVPVRRICSRQGLFFYDFRVDKILEKCYFKTRLGKTN